MSALREALGELPEAVFADLLESDDAYLVVMDVPGATAETVDARLSAGRLSIEARRAKDVPAEFEYVSEERSLFLDVDLPVPPDATAAEAEATVEKGVLELYLPKREAESETTIPVDERE